MSETEHDTRQESPLKTRGVRGMSLSRWAVVLLLPAFAFGFTGWLWWLSQGLESRVLEAIQPHLATDVSIGGVSVSVWSSWPDVEVQLKDLRIEDANQAGHDFLQLQEVGLRLAWLPLLKDRLEVRALRLEGGRVDLRQDGNGKGNWVFWKDGETEGQGAGVKEWSVDHFQLTRVLSTGDLRTGSGQVKWSGLLEDGQLSLSKGQAEEVSLRGEIEGREISVMSGGTTWLDDVGLSADLGGRFSADNTTLGFQNAALSGDDGAVPLVATLVLRGDRFGLSLSAQDADMEALEGVLPPQVRVGFGPALEGFKGRADLELRTGKEALAGLSSGGWTGPDEAVWDGVWAVNLQPQSLQWFRNDEGMVIQGGEAFAFSTKSGWVASSKGLTGSAAGGEFLVKAEAESSGPVTQVLADGQGVFRPDQAYRWVSADDGLGDGWRLEDKGSIRLNGAVRLKRNGDSPWQVAVDSGTTLAAESLKASRGQHEVNVERLSWEQLEDGWTLNADGMKAPGASASMALDMRGSSGHATMDIQSLDVNEVMAVFKTGETTTGADLSSLPQKWKLELNSGKTSFGPLELDEWSMTGQLSEGLLVAEELKARAFGGDLQASGRWNGNAMVLDGRLSNAELSEFLVGTSGLGQATVLPKHVRGRLWAEGELRFDPSQTTEVPWDADVDVRVEGGELVGFDLLQEIPATLAKEKKYRFIADADDLMRRLQRVAFEPVTGHIELQRGLITLSPMEVFSDAMNVGVEGWYRLGGEMDFTLDFAMRDLKSNDAEWGPVAEDGLGHRFFLAMRGTMDEPSFGYDRMAHQAHRKEQRQGAWGRLKGALGVETESGTSNSSLDTPSEEAPGSEGVAPMPPPETVPQEAQKTKAIIEDDDDDF